MTDAELMAVLNERDRLRAEVEALKAERGYLFTEVDELQSELAEVRRMLLPHPDAKDGEDAGCGCDLHTAVTAAAWAAAEMKRCWAELAALRAHNTRGERMKVVYIAGPIRKGGIWQNVAQADDAMLALMRAGLCVINPMLSCWAGAARAELDAGGPHCQSSPHPLAYGGFRDLGAEPWLTMDLELVARSDALLRLPGESTGADGEVCHAVRLGIPCFETVEEVVEWAALRAGGDRVQHTGGE